MKPDTTYTVHYPFGIEPVPTNSRELAMRARKLGFEVKAETGYRVVG